MFDDDTPEENDKEDDAPDGDEEGAEGEEGEEGEDGKSKKGGKKKLLIILVPIILLIVVGAGLFFTGMLDGLLGKKGDAGEHGDGHGDEHVGGAGDDYGAHGAAKAHFLKIPDMIVNLSTDDEQPRYLRMTVQLELETEADWQAVQDVIPRVVNQFQTYLRELRMRDLQGSQGIYRLRMELLERVNAATAPVEVKNVLFQEMLVQ